MSFHAERLYDLCLNRGRGGEGVLQGIRIRRVKNWDPVLPPVTNNTQTQAAASEKFLPSSHTVTVTVATRLQYIVQSKKLYIDHMTWTITATHWSIVRYGRRCGSGV